MCCTMQCVQWHEALCRIKREKYMSKIPNTKTKRNSALLTSNLPMWCILICISEHRRGGILPELFPGVLEFNANLKGKPLLNREYRDFGANRNPEFEDFMKHLLSEISPTRNQHKKDDCCKNLCHRLSLLLMKHLDWWSWITNYIYGITRHHWRT